MKPLCVRLYTGNIRPYLQPDRMKAAGQAFSWRNWIAWERFPTDAAGGPLRLVALTCLVDGQEQTHFLAPGLDESSLEKLLKKILRIALRLRRPR